MELIYNGESKYTIPSNITEIKEENFYFSELKEITVPGNVKKIGARAFSFSVKLKKVIIEPGVEEIGESAFENCDELETVVLPESVTSIGANAFFSCEKLKKINLPKSLEILNEGTFFGCEGLEKIDLPDTLKELGSNLFFDCESLKEITIPASVTKIPEGVFVNCKSLASAVIPDSVRQLEISAFASCENLPELNIPKNAEFYASAKNYTDTVDRSKKLTCINIHPQNPYYTSIDGVVYSKDKSTLLGWPMAKAGEFTVPEEVVSIGEMAFTGAINLTKINIGKNVKNIGDKAFYNVKSLEEINVDKNNRSYVSEDGVLYNKDMSVLIAYPNMKKDEIFTVPETVQYLVNNFEGSENLKKICLSKNTEQILGIFENCKNLTDFEVARDNSVFAGEDGVLFSKDKTVIIQYPQSKEDECYTIPDTVTNIKEKAFFGAKLLKDFKISKHALTRAMKIKSLK